jgi:hypothetical protein
MPTAGGVRCSMCISASRWCSAFVSSDISSFAAVAHTVDSMYALEFWQHQALTIHEHILGSTSVVLILNLAPSPLSYCTAAGDTVLPGAAV